MKVKCINVLGLETLLTLGKEYRIENISNRFYVIKNDKGIYSRYSKDRFVIMTAKKEEVALVVHDSKLEEEKAEVIQTYLDFTDEAVVTKEEEPLMETIEFEAKGLNEAILGAKAIGDYEQIGLNIGQLVDIKNAQYGDAVKTLGKVLEILYPNGIKPEQYTDLGAIVRILDKIFRISRGNQGSENAYMDLAGYSILMSKEDK